MKQQQTKDQVIVIGGGAAGFFFAINLAQMRPDMQVIILEKSNQVLGKVKVSGGGRCNVTHACFDPSDLISYYPRGGKELLGPFHHFQPGDTVAWFEERHVSLHIESDGRMFPSTNQSQTIIDCFLAEAKKYQVQVHTDTAVQSIQPESTGVRVQTNKREYQAKYCVIACGSSTFMWSIIATLGHTIEKPVPSLFTFHIQDPRIQGLMGVAVSHVRLHIPNTDIETEGPLLITHWGLSGPAVLKASAWGARWMAGQQYKCPIAINFLPQHDEQSAFQTLQQLRTTHQRKTLFNTPITPITSRLWKQLCQYSGITEDVHFADCSNALLLKLAQTLTNSTFQVKGKSTFKEEFVTCGGVRLAEIDMRTMESKRVKNLFFAGEVMDIDAVTGGFNFQAAWTTAFLAAHAIAIKP